MVPGAGENRVQRNLAGHPVVPVPSQILAIGLGTEHEIGPDPPDLPDDLPAEVAGILQFAVGMVQLYYLFDTKYPGRVTLLLLSAGPSFLGADTTVADALSPVGTKYEVDGSPLLNPLGQGAAAPKFRVIGMGGNYQYSLRSFFHPKNTSN